MLHRSASRLLHPRFRLFTSPVLVLDPEEALTKRNRASNWLPQNYVLRYHASGGVDGGLHAIIVSTRKYSGRLVHGQGLLLQAVAFGERSYKVSIQLAVIYLVSQRVASDWAICLLGARRAKNRKTIWTIALSQYPMAALQPGTQVN